MLMLNKYEYLLTHQNMTEKWTTGLLFEASFDLLMDHGDWREIQVFLLEKESNLGQDQLKSLVIVCLQKSIQIMINFSL